ncbi:putative ATP-dependent RNA helicase dhr2 [Pichia californica]|uniref:RNA helicase n=1 Tax=Pichia californica TaxID=460514 RepID=A0A9P6WGS2_9ASCO|nr:putative ATP-dependent RNA helicase dhr2 [[Candida] californica]KAG0686904.1 putative ATP-dependent RNA helicase dhr2 [[Candida] californica]
MGRRQKQNKKIVFSDTEFECAIPEVAPENNENPSQTQNTKNHHASKSTKETNRNNSSYKTVYFEDKSTEDNDEEYLRENAESDDEEIYQLDERKTRNQLKEHAEKLYQIRKTLPVYKVKDEIIPQLLESPVTILIGETGSGKSTQIPQFLMDISKKNIAVTQPRRVAAMNLAIRVAEEYGCHIGEEVGYSVRFNNVTTNKTKLKYITDGMLLREMMIDPKLSKYSTIIVDEAHERTILTDLLIGFLKGLLIERNANADKPTFKVIIMSATLDAEKFSKFFDNAPILFVEGKMFPVERYYIDKPADDIIDAMVKSVVQLNQGEQSGDILCFLPGQEDIDKAVNILTDIAPELPKEAPMIVPMPLYAALPPQQQMRIFAKLKPRQRKIIISTNIAETSVTVPGIKYVIDSGLRKVKVWRHQLGLSTLLTVPISKASATQRAGRAGRESAGKCFRLYKESDYFKLTDTTEPEILRSEIISPVLMLKKLGVNDILGWHWLENPGHDSLIASLQQLYSLGALDNSGNITDLGEKMVILPVAPHLAAVLIQAQELNTLNEVIDIVSCLSVDNLLITPSSEKRDDINALRLETCSLGSQFGDLIMLKELFDIFNTIKEANEKKKWCKEIAVSYKGFKNVNRIRKQIKDYMSLLENGDDHVMYEDDENDHINSPLNVELILKSFLKGFITNTAIGMPDRSYRTVTNGNLISIHPSSLLFGSKKDAMMYIEFVYTVKGYARNVSAIKLEWLQEVAPQLQGAKVSVSKS